MVYVDQLNRGINLINTPKRIISLVPSQTELLIDLGLGDKIVGITKFCVHPDTLRKEKTIVGGTKKINYNKIKALQPDIILCNKEENTKEIVETLEREYVVHVSDIFTLYDAFEMIEQYGKVFNIETKTNKLISEIKVEKESLDHFIKQLPKKRVVYFIWKDPWMAVGGNTFINHLLKLNNFENVYEDQTRYPEVSIDHIRSLTDIDLILLSSEPYPFSEKHVKEIKNSNTKAQVVLVDGEYFSWYGSRLLGAFAYFKTLHSK